MDDASNALVDSDKIVVIILCVPAFIVADSINAVETRGLWRTYNDFMGGPFVCYTFTLPESGKVYTLMGCVYSPSERNKMVMKRDLLMQLDGICRSIKLQKDITE